NLVRVLARQKRRDFLFNLLGITCTLVGVVTLVVLLADLVIDGLGLLGQYRKDVCSVSEAKLSVKKEKRDDRSVHVLTLILPDGTFTGEIRSSDAAVIEDSDPHGMVTLEGDRLRVPFGEPRPGKVQERVDLKLTRDEVKHLTRDDSNWMKSRQVFGRFLTAFS